MAATPKGGSCIFRGLQSGQTYIKDVYNPDVAGSTLKFDAGAGAAAASPDFATFNEAVALVDVSVVTGIVDTTKVRVVANGVPTTNVLQWATHLNSLNMRPQLNIGFNAGTRVQFICVA
jgi:hypothetical protein